MKQYDYLIVGGGAAGLSLAYHLANSSLRDKKILIIDRERKNTNDRTWCFWSQRPTFFTPICFRKWEKIRFQSFQFSKDYSIKPYQYNMLRGIDFYEFVQAELAVRNNIDFLTAPVTSVWETPHVAMVCAGGDTFQGTWCFDSRYNPVTISRDRRRYHYLLQHFLGWEIETASDVFDPAVPSLFDFRTPQEGSMRFMYVLPFTTRKALVEYTVFSASPFDREDYEKGLADYLRRYYSLDQYSILSKETGIIPMTDHPFHRRSGDKILNIGTRGGQVKPSSGYAFHRIQKDSAAIIRSLEKRGHPFDLPQPNGGYRLLDSVLLQILTHKGCLGEEIFTRMFRSNSISTIFRFLDETASLWENYRILASVPPTPFIRSWIRIKVLGLI